MRPVIAEGQWTGWLPEEATSSGVREEVRLLRGQADDQGHEPDARRGLHGHMLCENQRYQAARSNQELTSTAST